MNIRWNVIYVFIYLLTPGEQAPEWAGKMMQNVQNTIVSTLNGLRDIRRVPIIFNETNNAEYIELEPDAKTNINSTEDLNRRLEKYGLKLEETEKTIKVLVVRDKTTAN